MGNRVKRERERERGRINDQPVITNRVLMFSLNGNASVVLVSLEIYHRIGSLQTSHQIKKKKEKKERHARVTFLFLTAISYITIPCDGHQIEH